MVIFGASSILYLNSLLSINSRVLPIDSKGVSCFSFTLSMVLDSVIFEFLRKALGFSSSIYTARITSFAFDALSILLMNS